MTVIDAGDGDPSINVNDAGAGDVPDLVDPELLQASGTSAAGGVRRLSTWEVWRPLAVDDGAGGQTVVMVFLRTERGDMRELTGQERIEAQQAGAEHTHTGYFRVRAGIERNDELRRGDDVLRVESVTPGFPENAGRTRVSARSVEAGG